MEIKIHPTHLAFTSSWHSEISSAQPIFLGSILLWENVECGRKTSLSQLGYQITEERNRKGTERDHLQQWHRWFFFLNQHFFTVIYAISTSRNIICYGWKVSLLNLWISKELVLRTVKEEQSVCKLLYWASWGLRWLGGFETVWNSYPGGARPQYSSSPHPTTPDVTPLH